MFKPHGYTSVAPYLITRRAAEVIEFLRRTFDAEELRRHDGDDGTVHHAEVRTTTPS